VESSDKGVRTAVRHNRDRQGGQVQLLATVVDPGLWHGIARSGYDHN